jgi:large subunit ribosomal protein L15e
MVKGLAYYLRQAWRKPDTETLRKRMIEWRASEAIVRVENPLRLDRAHSLGYKAKKGVFVVRVRLIRGGHVRPRPNKARRSARLHTRISLKMNYRQIAEARAAVKYPNCEVLNSYWIGKDGMNYFYEVILVDRTAPEIKTDKELGFLAKPANYKRIFRGLTSAASKARGLRNSNFKVPKVRPSLRANNRQGN